MGLMDAHELDQSAGDFFQIEAELARAPRPRVEERSKIVDFYKDRSVFITGASGFIGKVLIEKLLRTCPEIRRIFVLIRPKWNKRPDERLTELLACPLFAGVRNQRQPVTGATIEERVIVVEGDVTQQNLGLSGQNLLRLTKEVSVIFHSAATVKFDEPLKQSVAINIAGTKNMIEFCRRCPQLAGLVHVSTAYANCDQPSIDEHVYPLAMDPEKIIQMADWLDLETMQELKKRLLGARPNTYTYTKALAEWLLVKSARDLPVVICRPSIVVASQEEPIKGWIDNFNGPTGVILGAGKGLVRTMYAEPECVADLVPVDKVINLMVTLGWFAYVSKNQKHLMNETTAESFTESPIPSGGPSSPAGSSSASTNGDAEQAVDAVANHVDNSERQANKLQGRNSNNNNNNKHHQRPTIISNQSCASSAPGSLSSASTPSLSGAEEEDDHEHEHEHARRLNIEVHGHHHHHHNYLDHDHLAARAPAAVDQRHQNQNHHNHHHDHHHHHHNHLTTQDDGYGSRSDYANSISSSSDSASSFANLKRRHQRRATGTNSDVVDLDMEKPLIRISSSDSGKQQQVNVNCCVSQNLVIVGGGVGNVVKSEQNKQLQKKQLQAELQLDNNNQTDVDGVLEYKLKEFRQRTRAKLLEKELPEELADIPVFHCTSGGENPISWGRVQLLVMTALSLFPSTSTYRYPSGAFTNNQLLHDFYRWTLHYLPAYLADLLSRLCGAKPMLVRIYQKFDQAANVLKAFTSKEWDFKYDNKLFLMRELMSDEDKRLFDCDITSLDWEQFIKDYAVGVRKFLLKEPMSNMEQARKNLAFTYYRNLSLQVLFFITSAYYMASSIGLFTTTLAT